MKLPNFAWKLVEFQTDGTTEPVLENTNPTLIFTRDGTMAAKGGCNSLFAEVAFDGENQISISSPRSTYRSCDEPKGVMEQDGKIFEYLLAAKFYVVEGNSLTLANSLKNGSELLRFDALQTKNYEIVAVDDAKS